MMGLPISCTSVESPTHHIYHLPLLTRTNHPYPLSILNRHLGNPFIINTSLLLKIFLALIKSLLGFHLPCALLLLPPN